MITGYALLLPRPLFDVPYSTVLYARDGALLGAKTAPDGQWRFPPATTVPDKYARAALEYEDRRFHRHAGVSLPAIVRAALQNWRAKEVVSGGSTLTMQLVRLSRGNPPRTVGEKLREMLLATRIEWSYTKEEILNLYAAHAPFGGNVVGLEAAAWRYFGHDPAGLSWAEAATLAVLPNSPALIHPGRSRKALLAKRDRLLRRLLQSGDLDSAEYAAALIEPLPDAPEPLPRHAPHLADRLPTGSVLHSTLDNALQQRTQQIVDNYGSWTLAANRIRNAAALVIDVQTGEALAYVGNITPDGSPREVGDGRAVDIIRSRRSTGSLLKPVLYGAMLSEGQILAGSLVFDTPLNIAGFTPSNYSKTFSGVVSASEAVARSLNVPIVRMLTQYNISRFLALLRSMGLTTLDRSADNYGATLILGGAEGTLWEMTGLYASLARSLETYNRVGHYQAGDMREPIFDLAPHGHAGAVTLAAADRPQPSRAEWDNFVAPPLAADQTLKSRREILAAAVTRTSPQQAEDNQRGANAQAQNESTTRLCPLTPSALWFMFRAMSGVNRPEEEAAWQEFSSMKQVAWKTGTSYGNRDAWAIGLTPRYAVGVWVGNADGEGRAGMTGVGSAAPIMFDIFSMLPAAGRWFDEPLGDMSATEVCLRSGHRASEWCRSSGDPVDTVHIPRAGIASPLCPFHKPVTTEAVTRGWFVLPPAAEYYYRLSASEYAVPPTAAGARPLELIYPQAGAVLYLPKGFSDRSRSSIPSSANSSEKFIFRAAHRSDTATLHWHLDNRYLGSTRSASAAGHTLAAAPGAGTHTLTVVDGEGKSQRIRFTVLKSE